MKEKEKYRLVVIVYPTTKIMTEKEWEQVHFRDNYVILETDRKSLKVGYYEVLQNIDESNIEPSPEEKILLFKKLGHKYNDRTSS